jgi:hypothetical protein
VIAAGQAAGVIKAGNPVELAISRWALVHGLSMLLLDGMLPPNSDAAYGSPDCQVGEAESRTIPLESSAIALVKSAIASSLTGLIN